MNIPHKVLWGIVAGLVVVVIVLVVVLITARPAAAPGSITPGSGSGGSSELSISSPRPNGTIGDPAQVAGTASGAWIQDSFNVEVFVGGLLAGSAPATFQQNGTSSVAVSFTANVPYSTSFSGKDAELVFVPNANASGTSPTPANFSLPVKIQ